VAMALGAAACLLPDSLAPELKTQLQRARESSLEGIEWVREMLKGHPPADIVVLYRSPDGRLLGSEMMTSPAPGARPQRVGPAYMEEVPTNSIESIEVVRGPALGVPGIDGVIVITLKVVTVESTFAGPGGRIVRGELTYIRLRPDTTGTSILQRVMP